MNLFSLLFIYHFVHKILISTIVTNKDVAIGALEVLVFLSTWSDKLLRFAPGAVLPLV